MAGLRIRQRREWFAQRRRERRERRFGAGHFFRWPGRIRLPIATPQYLGSLCASARTIILFGRPLANRYEKARRSVVEQRAFSLFQVVKIR